LKINGYTMTHTYTISNTTANSGTITLTTSPGAGAVVTGPAYNLNSGAGQIYTTNGTSASNWATTSTQFNSSNGKPIMTVPNGKDEVILEKDATLNIKGNVVINGFDLEERLKTIERVLTIPERDVKLEKKYPKLKKMYDEYITALGKYRTFEAIKGDEDGTT
jgi:hypothetical protein